MPEGLKAGDARDENPQANQDRRQTEQTEQIEEAMIKNQSRPNLSPATHKMTTGKLSKLKKLKALIQQRAKLPEQRATQHSATPAQMITNQPRPNLSPKVSKPATHEMTTGKLSKLKMSKALI
eukprot:gene20302-31250_t